MTARDRHEIASGEVPGQLEVQVADAKRCPAGVMHHLHSGTPGQYALHIQRAASSSPIPTQTTNAGRTVDYGAPRRSRLVNRKSLDAATKVRKLDQRLVCLLSLGSLPSLRS